MEPWTPQTQVLRQIYNSIFSIIEQVLNLIGKQLVTPIKLIILLPVDMSVIIIAHRVHTQVKLLIIFPRTLHSTF